MTHDPITDDSPGHHVMHGEYSVLGFEFSVFGQLLGVALVPLLVPRIPTVVVAELLPEPRLVVR